jgi:hypothetical protein
MNDKRSNNVEIGNIFDSTVTFNQSQDNAHSINSQHIEYEIDHNTLAITPMARHSRNAVINFTTMMVAAIALLADLSGLVDVNGFLSYFNISKVTAFFVLVPISLLVILVTHHDFWITKLSPGIANLKKASGTKILIMERLHHTSKEQNAYTRNAMASLMSLRHLQKKSTTIQSSEYLTSPLCKFS